MPTIIQANSLFIDFELPNFAAGDPAWANWTGTYEVSSTLVSTPILTGSLDKTVEGIMRLRLLSSNALWTAIAVGNYKLMVEFNNTSIGYREERQDRLIVKAQGM
jgi:hypothetical protein